MQFHILRETPDNSGCYVATGETHDGPADAAAQRCVELSSAGGRYALHVYESLRFEGAVSAPAVEPAEAAEPAAAAEHDDEPAAEPPA